jgi:hypothetical protein
LYIRTSSIRFSIPKSVNAWTPSSPTPIYPDGAVLDLQFDGDIPQPIFVFAEILRDLSNGSDVVHLVDVHDHAALAESVAVSDVQFHGSGSSSR